MSLVSHTCCSKRTDRCTGRDGNLLALLNHVDVFLPNENEERYALLGS